MCVGVCECRCMCGDVCGYMCEGVCGYMCGGVCVFVYVYGVMCMIVREGFVCLLEIILLERGS